MNLKLACSKSSSRTEKYFKNFPAFVFGSKNSRNFKKLPSPRINCLWDDLSRYRTFLLLAKKITENKNVIVVKTIRGRSECKTNGYNTRRLLLLRKRHRIFVTLERKEQPRARAAGSTDSVESNKSGVAHKCTIKGVILCAFVKRGNN